MICATEVHIRWCIDLLNRGTVFCNYSLCAVPGREIAKCDKKFSAEIAAELAESTLTSELKVHSPD